MFYCDECVKKKGYPESIMKSLGPCEICGKKAECNDRPSSSLPKSNNENTRKYYETLKAIDSPD